MKKSNRVNPNLFEEIEISDLTRCTISRIDELENLLKVFDVNSDKELIDKYTEELTRIKVLQEKILKM